MEQAMFEFARMALEEFASEWRSRRAIRNLDGLNDHLLDDVGLRREQLPLLLLEAKERDREPALLNAYHPELLPCG
jgi:uncharacterized protein YjiS (DUF1127 family)